MDLDLTRSTYRGESTLQHTTTRILLIGLSLAGILILWGFYAEISASWAMFILFLATIASSVAATLAFVRAEQVGEFSTRVVRTLTVVVIVAFIIAVIHEPLGYLFADAKESDDSGQTDDDDATEDKAQNEPSDDPEPRAKRASPTITVGSMTLNVPPGPDPANTPPDLMTKIAAGKELLGKTPLYERKECRNGKRCRDLLLAVASVDGEIKVIKAEETGIQNKNVKWPIWTCDTGGFEVTGLSAFNGVNTNLEITVPVGWTVVANKYNIGQGGKRVPAIYVPYNRGLDTPEVREAGLRYLAGISWEVWSDFRDRDVRSKHVAGTKITDIVGPEMLVTIVLVENSDADRFDQCADEACRLGLANNALVLIGANGADAFKYRFSSVGAGGLAQLWKPSYNGLRRQYPEAALPAEFKAVTQHKVAITAALCHFDAELQPLSQARINHYRTHPEALQQYLAAAYNGSARRVNKAINDHGADWRQGRNLCTSRNCETRTYLEKYDFVWKATFEQGVDPTVLNTGFYTNQ